MKRSSGFTLIELMVTLSVMAILATLAAPSFTSLIQNSRTTTQTNELVAALNLARSEAVKRGVDVQVTPEDGSFVNGWCVHLMPDCDEDRVLRIYPEMRQVAVTNSASVRFDGRGAKVDPGNLAMGIAPQSCAAGSDRRRELSVSNTGRVSVARKDC